MPVDFSKMDPRISCPHSHPICDMCLAVMAEAGDGEEYAEVMALLDQYEEQEKEEFHIPVDDSEK